MTKQEFQKIIETAEQGKGGTWKEAFALADDLHAHFGSARVVTTFRAAAALLAYQAQTLDGAWIPAEVTNMQAWFQQGRLMLVEMQS